MANPDPSPETRWKPGQSGNPGGMPKGRSITARLRQLLDETKLTKEQGETILDRIAMQVIRKSLKGDHRFVETLLDRTEGKVPIQVQTPDVDLEAVREKLKAKRASRPDGGDRGSPGGMSG